jgi:hypothetical protein
MSARCKYTLFFWSFILFFCGQVSAKSMSASNFATNIAALEDLRITWVQSTVISRYAIDMTLDYDLNDHPRSLTNLQDRSDLQDQVVNLLISGLSEVTDTQKLMLISGQVIQWMQNNTAFKLRIKIYFENGAQLKIIEHSDSKPTQFYFLGLAVDGKYSQQTH